MIRGKSKDRKGVEDIHKWDLGQPLSLHHLWLRFLSCVGGHLIQLVGQFPVSEPFDHRIKRVSVSLRVPLPLADGCI